MYCMNLLAILNFCVRGFVIVLVKYFGYMFGAMWYKIKIIYSKLPIFLITKTSKPFGIVHDIK